jgi:predicted amidohydrolase YtcJ
VANSLALRLAGIGADTPDPEGGRIERGADGTPSGVLMEPPAFEPVARSGAAGVGRRTSSTACAPCRRATTPPA